MKRLIFDCSGDIASIAVLDGEEVLSELSVTGKKNHAAILLPSIDSCLKEAELSFADVDEVYVCSGPGSFTGVKVGLSTALGLVQPTRKRLFVFPYAALILSRALAIYPRLLDEYSSDFADNAADGKIVLAMDAGRGEKYCTELTVSPDAVCFSDSSPSSAFTPSSALTQSSDFASAARSIGSSYEGAESAAASVAADEFRVTITASRLVRDVDMPKHFEFRDLPVRYLFEMPEMYRRLFLSEDLKPLYFRKSQAEESMEQRERR